MRVSIKSGNTILFYSWLQIEDALYDAECTHLFADFKMQSVCLRRTCQSYLQSMSTLLRATGTLVHMIKLDPLHYKISTI